MYYQDKSYHKNVGRWKPTAATLSTLHLIPIRQLQCQWLKKECKGKWTPKYDLQHLKKNHTEINQNSSVILGQGLFRMWDFYNNILLV